MSAQKKPIDRIADPEMRRMFRRYEVALFLFDAAKEDNAIDMFRAVERKFPDLSFSDFVFAAAKVDDAAHKSIDEAKARQRPH